MPPTAAAGTDRARLRAVALVQRQQARRSRGLPHLRVRAGADRLACPARRRIRGPPSCRRRCCCRAATVSAEHDAKTSRSLLHRLPSCWNIVVCLSVRCSSCRPTSNAVILLGFAAMVFVPIRYIYPSRTTILPRTDEPAAARCGVPMLIVIRGSIRRCRVRSCSPRWRSGLLLRCSRWWSTPDLERAQSSSHGADRDPRPQPRADDRATATGRGCFAAACPRSSTPAPATAASRWRRRGARRRTARAGAGDARARRPRVGRSGAGGAVSRRQVPQDALAGARQPSGPSRGIRSCRASSSRPATACSRRCTRRGTRPITCASGTARAGRSTAATWRSAAPRSGSRSICAATSRTTSPRSSASSPSSLRRLLPAHGEVIDDPGLLLRRYVEHRLARERQIVDAMREAARHR